MFKNLVAFIHHLATDLVGGEELVGVAESELLLLSQTVLFCPLLSEPGLGLAVCSCHPLLVGTGSYKVREVRCGSY